MSRIAIIERCGQCEHFAETSAGTVCLEKQRFVAWGGAPPGCCPLPPAAEVARVKRPLLQWERESGNTPACEAATTMGSIYRVFERVVDDKPQWVWKLYGDPVTVCDSLEAGKAACEAHYRAALFGEHGPLVQLYGCATTQEAAPNETQAHNQGEKPHCGGTD